MKTLQECKDYITSQESVLYNTYALAKEFGTVSMDVIDTKATELYERQFNDNSEKVKQREDMSNQTKDERFNPYNSSLIEELKAELKQTTDCDASWHSGVNDGMYKLLQYLLTHDLIKGSEWNSVLDGMRKTLSEQWMIMEQAHKIISGNDDIFQYKFVKTKNITETEIDKYYEMWDAFNSLSPKNYTPLSES